MNTRRAAAEAVCRVIHEGRSLSIALSDVMPHDFDERDNAFTQALSYGVSRWYWELDFLLGRLAPRPVKDPLIRCLALVGLYQLRHTRVKPHAAVAETVAASPKAWAKPFLNALLRGYQREKDRLESAVAIENTARTAHPRWLIERLAADWPLEYPRILEENNLSPPMTLRVNRLQADRPAYLARLQEQGIGARPGIFCDSAVILDEPLPVLKLPGFSEGLVSVQDEAAQLAARLLDVQPGHRVLDLCAAPGGKSAHILEMCPGLGELLAVDLAPDRVAMIRAGFKRLGLSANILVGDALAESDWWDGRPFDRILLDAPCSATGVIRRHPDIKLLRRPADLAPLTVRQRHMLEAAWRMLRQGGLVLYATCSVLREENEANIAAFMSAHPEAGVRPLEQRWGRATGYGRQILPGDDGMDGFFYACLTKMA